MARVCRNARRNVLLLVCAAALLGLGACRARQPGSGGVAIRLQTDWYPQPEMGGFYQAEMEGLYKAQGLDVTIVPGGPFVVAEQQVASGAAQFAMGSSDKVLVSVSQGLPLVAVGATMQQDPQAVMVHAESPVKDFPDLEGHTIAAKPGSIWFEYLLKRYGLKNVKEIPATYSVANFLEDPNYIQQCFVTSEPYFANKAGAKVRTLLISATGYQPYRVIFTSRDFVAAHPDEVAKFVKASVQGWQGYLTDPARVDAELTKLNPAMSPDQMAFSVQELKSGHFIDGDGSAESHLGHFAADRWSKIYEQLRDLGVITHPIDPGSAYTSLYAP